MLEVACRRFERCGRLPIERLIAEHSAAVLVRLKFRPLGSAIV